MKALKVIWFGYLLICCHFISLGQEQEMGTELKNYYDQNDAHIHEIFYVKDTNYMELEGPYKSYYFSGGLKSEGYYKENEPVRNWRYYYENGNLKMTGELKNNSNYGPWIYYFENSNKSMEGELFGGKREGKWKFYFENGQLKSDGSFSKGIRDGNWNYYYESGELKAKINYKDGRGIYQEFHTTGELKMEGLNVDGKSDSLWHFYYENGSIKAEGNYKSGKKNGPWKYYYLNGMKSAEGIYAEGVTFGNWKYYYEDGNISSEGLEKEGQKEGYWKLYYRSGAVKGDGVFISGNGQYKEYYSNGKLKVEGYIQKGKNHGSWYYYYEDGSLEGKANFIEGTGDYLGYYDNGAIKVEGRIEDDRKVGRWKLYEKDGTLAGYYKPIYEENSPQFSVNDPPVLEKGPYEKPEYKFKSTRVKYFTPKINEYRAFVVGTNPVLSIAGFLPFALEYYYQERLGYELIFSFIRNPFFTSDVNVKVGDLYKRGYSIALRQKFYENNKKHGMFYFGHELYYTSLNHFVNIVDSTSTNLSRLSFRADEEKFEYGFFLGSRFITEAGQGGFTLDLFVGLDVGYRNFNEDPGNIPEASTLFDDLNRSTVSTQFRFGANIGFMGPVRKPGSNPSR